MKKSNGCDYEPRVVKSLKVGTRDEVISAHLESCADCRETARIVGFFQTNISREAAPQHLPTAGLVWWKAKLREKRRAATRAARPIFIARAVAVIISLLAAVGLLIYQPAFFAPLGAVINRIFDTLGQMAPTLFAGFLTLAVVLAAVVFTLRRWTSD